MQFAWTPAYCLSKLGPATPSPSYYTPPTGTIIFEVTMIAPERGAFGNSYAWWLHANLREKSSHFPLYKRL